MVTKCATKKQIPVNGPFALRPIDGDRRFGITGNVADAPLVVDAVGVDGLAPHDSAGQPVPIRVAFRTIRVPEAA